MAEPTPEMKPLERLFGKWKTTGRTAAEPDQPSQDVDFTDIYRWTLGGHFIEHEVDGRLGDLHLQTLEMIGWDREAGAFVSTSFDNTGQRLTQRPSIDGEVLKIDGDSMRFEGRFNADATVIEGAWEKADDGGWKPLMDITLKRQ